MTLKPPGAKNISSHYERSKIAESEVSETVISSGSSSTESNITHRELRADDSELDFKNDAVS
jgi:hypothetical protein